MATRKPGPRKRNSWCQNARLKHEGRWLAWSLDEDGVPNVAPSHETVDAEADSLNFAVEDADTRSATATSGDSSLPESRTTELCAYSEDDIVFTLVWRNHSFLTHNFVDR